MASVTATRPKNSTKDLTETAINTIRFLSVDAVEKAKSGHPGTPMALAPLGYLLYTGVMKHNPKNPGWINRDRFILSAGHASMLLYSMLHLTGYNLSLDEIRNFRQWGSKTPGHPEYGDAPGIETTTGPLGQGISTAVGIAIAQRYLNSLFTPKGKALLDHYIYGICSDGDLMEGVASEAASLAGHLGLGQMIFFYDDNHISIEGDTALAFDENVAARFKAYDWHVQKVADANDLEALKAAVKEAQSVKDKPSLIVVRSHIGYGSPNKQDDAEAHGAPLGADEVKLTKENLGWPQEPAFLVPEEVKPLFRKAIDAGAKAEGEWNKRFQEWSSKNPEGAKLWKRLAAGELPEGWHKSLPTFEGDEKLATRAASGKTINAIAAALPELIGGSADLAPSNNTLIKGAADFSKENPGRNLRFGVREHAMGAALNGMALSEMLIPYGGTFLIFTDYMKGAMRIAALNKKRVVYVLTHDSIGLGEDGPTHQPIEQLAALRAMPNILVIRPADAIETAAAWKVALEHKTGPVALALTRQNLPVLHRATYPAVGQVEKGAYVLADAGQGAPELILIATGSEVSLALAAREKLEAAGIATRVVSMPCWELFSAQSGDYRESVLPENVKKRISIEALSTFGWERWVGPEGLCIGMPSFGKSAPGNVAMENFGFNAGNVVAKAKELLGR